MANYIDEEILCESYTHLDIDTYNDPEALKKLKDILIPYFEDRAKFLLGNDVEVRIEFEEGSLKTKLQVVGSAGLILLNAVNPIKNPMGTLASVIAYGPFRESIKQLADDATLLAQSANLEVIFQTQTDHCDRVNVERRKGIFGRVDDALDQLNSIKAAAEGDDIPSNHIRMEESSQVVQNLIEWNIRIERLFEKISSTETQECMAAGILEEVKKMPKEFVWTKKLENQDFRIKLLKSDPNAFGQVEAISAQYSAVLKSIKLNLEKRIKVASEKK
jgi:hypothetical protein